MINSVGKDTLTVIAAHDLRTPPGSREATIERFQGNRPSDRSDTGQQARGECPIDANCSAATERELVPGPRVQPKFACSRLATVADFQGQQQDPTGRTRRTLNGCVNMRRNWRGVRRNYAHERSIPLWPASRSVRNAGIHRGLEERAGWRKRPAERPRHLPISRPAKLQAE